MLKKVKVFVSYDYDKDRNFKELLNAWSKNQKFDFKIKDVSTDISINSKDVNYIKKCIAKDISDCNIFLVPIGKDTHKSEWVNKFEIPKAFELNKRIVGVLLSKANKIPESFKKYGDLLCDEFNFKNISTLLENKCTKFSKPIGIELHRIKCK